MLNKRGEIWNEIKHERKKYNAGFKNAFMLVAAVLIIMGIGIAIYKLGEYLWGRVT